MIPIKEVAKVIANRHRYYINPEFWGRIGSLCDRYGGNMVKKIVEEMPTDTTNLDHLFNIVENKCQKTIANSGLDDLAKDILDEIQLN